MLGAYIHLYIHFPHGRWCLHPSMWAYPSVHKREEGKRSLDLEPILPSLALGDEKVDFGSRNSGSDQQSSHAKPGNLVGRCPLHCSALSSLVGLLLDDDPELLSLHTQQKEEV